MTLDSVLLASLGGLVGVVQGVLSRPGIETVKDRLRRRLEPACAQNRVLNGLMAKRLAPGNAETITRNRLPSMLLSFLGGLVLVGFGGAVVASAWPLVRQAFASDPFGVLSRAGLEVTAYLAMFAIGSYASRAFMTDLVLLLVRSWSQLWRKTA